MGDGRMKNKILQMGNDGRPLPIEIALLYRCIDIPGAVQMYDWYELSHGYIIVMERMDNAQDFFDFISDRKYLKESLAKYLFKQVSYISEEV